MDLDLARRFVGADLDRNCLQKLSADDISRQRVKESQISKFQYCCRSIGGGGNLYIYIYIYIYIYS